MGMARDTTHIRVTEVSRWAIKIAGAHLDCTVADVITRMLSRDKVALRAAWAAMDEVTK